MSLNPSALTDQDAVENSLYQSFVTRILEDIRTSKRFDIDPKNYTTRHPYYQFCLQNTISGLWLEFGVWEARTIHIFAGLRPEVPIYGFDSFEGLPEDWIPDFPKGSFDRKGKAPAVEADNVHFIVGLFQETLAPFLQTHTDQCAVIHIDCDLYSATDYVLKTLAERIQPGTILLFDEFYNYEGFEGHEMKALYNFLTEGNYGYSVLAHTASKQVCIQIIEK